MTYPGNGAGPRPTKAGTRLVAPSSVADVTAPLSEAEAVEMRDIKCRAGIERSRRTWLDLQVGDRFWHLGEELGVLHVGPIEQIDGYFMREVVVMPVAGGDWRRKWVSNGVTYTLYDVTHVATPAEAARVAAAWREIVSSSRAELARLRAEYGVAG